MVHLIDEENVVTCVDFEYDYNFYLEAPTEIKHIITELKFDSGSVETVSASQVAKNTAVF